MNFSEYQDKAEQFAVFPEDVKLTYSALGLVNEAGEYAGKVKKLLRGDTILNDEYKLGLLSELGDVLWYVSACASALDLDLDSIAHMNIAKLTDRQQRGVIKGSGDNR